MICLTGGGDLAGLDSGGLAEGMTAVRLPRYSPAVGGTAVQKKLEAALILRGVVRVRTAAGEMELAPRTWYREAGEHYVEGRRRDSGEHVRIRLSEIRDIQAY